MLTRSLRYTPPATHSDSLAQWTPHLPSELWAKIFRECLLADEYPQLHGSMLTAVIIGVCRKWRCIALGCGELWASFGIAVHAGSTETPPYEVLRRKFTLWLRRSKHYPLCVSILCAPKSLQKRSSNQEKQAELCAFISQLLESLLQHKRRLRSLLLHVPSEATSMLQVLHHGCLPMLSKLDIETVGTDASLTLDLSSADINWSQLTTLHLSIFPRMTLDECHRILSKATKLESCCITVEGPSLLPAEPYRLIELKGLRRLNLRLTGSPFGTSPSSFAAFFASLNLPVLRDLRTSCLFDYDDADSGFLAELKSLIMRSSRSLIVLHLTNVYFNDQDLLSLLSCIRYIEDLGLRFPLQASHDPISEELIRALDSGFHSQRIDLPSLRVLKLQCYGTRFTERSLIKMLASRFKEKGLRIFDLFFALRISSSLRDRFDSWAKSGIQATVSSLVSP